MTADKRTGAAAVRRYLEALDGNRPRRGRRRTAESVNKRLSAIEEQIQDAAPLQRLALVQERMDLQRELETMGESSNIGELEEAFVAVAKSYGDRKGISYAAWRELGVPAEVLKRAGIPRTRRTSG